MSKRKLSIDLLRILACIAVIIIHVSALNMDLLKIDSPAWQARNFYDGIARFSVPIFVMISGMFMLDPARELSLGRLYKKYVFRILVLWLVWELFYALVDFWNMEYEISFASLKPLIDEVFKGHFHLWYLPMLIGLYIMTPLFRAITEKDDKALMQYFIALFFVFTVLRLTLPLFAKPGDEFFGDFLVFIDKVPVTIVLRYSGYYMLGYYLYKYPLKKTSRYISYALGILGAALTIYISASLSIKFGEGHGIFDFFYISVFFMSAGLFTFFKDTVSKLKIGDLTAKLLSGVSSCCFGVYLLHAFIIERINKLGLTVSSFNPALSIPLIAFLAFFVSCVLVFVFKVSFSKLKAAIFKEKSYAKI